MSECLKQQQVSAAHVMVVGCGALGNEVLKNLVLLGVGHLVVVDLMWWRLAICHAPYSLRRLMLMRIV